MKTEFVTIGETCAVFAATQIGRMRYCKAYEIRPGGAESTVAVGVARLGHSASWISRLGEDELGHYLLSLIRGEGVHVECDLIDSAPTGVFIRERMPAGKARHFYYRSGSAFSTMGPEDLPLELIATARVLHVTGITPALSQKNAEMVLAAMKHARAHGVTVVFDPNMRRTLWSAEDARQTMVPIMALADYVLPGLEDLEGMYGESLTVQEAMDRIREIGCPLTVLKLAEKGAAIVSSKGFEVVPSVPVAVPVDVMGAGDAFAAGFVTGLLESLPVREAVELGNAVAGLSIQAPGNLESMPTRQEVENARQGKKPVER